MRKLCDVLKSLHTLTPPIIHRDLKLSNIILTSENLVYIVDFDTARYYESGQEQDTELLGTKEYAPPEQYGFGQSRISYWKAVENDLGILRVSLFSLL